MTIKLSYAESVEIAAPIEKVFAYRLDYSNLAEYMPAVKNVRRVDGGSEPGPGADYRFDLTIEGMGDMEAFLTVVEVDAPGRIVQDTGSTAMGGREVCTFTALADGGTRVRFSFTISLPDEAKDGVPFVEESGRKGFRTELDNLKKLFEGG